MNLVYHVNRTHTRTPTEKTSCIPCPNDGLILYTGADSSERCRVYYGNFDLNNRRPNLEGLKNHQLSYSDAVPSDRLRFNGTVMGWNVKLAQPGTVFLIFWYRIEHGLRE